MVVGPDLFEVAKFRRSQQGLAQAGPGGDLGVLDLHFFVFRGPFAPVNVIGIGRRRRSNFVRR